MAITRRQFNNILNEIFKSGNKIELFAEMPNEQTESGEIKISGTGYLPYIIKSGDFLVSDGSATSNQNIMMYLCDAVGGHGTAKGFGIYEGSTLLYFGEFTTPMSIGYNTVPTIKKYNKEKQEGIKVTMTSTEVAASAE